MFSDYELASDQEDARSSQPSSPFSLISTAHIDELTTSDLSDLELENDSETEGLDARSASGSEQDWSFIHQHARGDQALVASPFSSGASDVSSMSCSSRTPSPQPAQLPAASAESTPGTPRVRSPQLLQLPVSDPAAQAFTLVRLLNLPAYWTLDELVELLTRGPAYLEHTFNFRGRLSLPLWISFRPPPADVDRSLATGDRNPNERSAALVRFMNPEDAACLADLFDHLKMQLAEREDLDLVEQWSWLLDLEVILLVDADAEKGEEGKGLLWLHDWLRNDEGKARGTTLSANKTASELITTILVTPLPSQVRLMNVVDLFVKKAPEGATLPIRIALLPDLAAHTIFLPCCILQFVDHTAAESAMKLLSGHDTLFFRPYARNSEGAECFLDATSSPETLKKCRVEYKPGDWWNYSFSTGGAEIWESASVVVKNELAATGLVPELLGTWTPSTSHHTARSVRDRHTGGSSQASRSSPASPQQEGTVQDRVPLTLMNSVMLVKLPFDVDIDEIVKVFTTPPVLSHPVSVHSHQEGSDSSTIIEQYGNIVSETSNPPALGDAAAERMVIEVPLPVSISVFESHPTFFPGERIAIITFHSHDAFMSGICLLPPSMWYRAGAGRALRGCFVKPEERDGSEIIFHCEYKYGQWTWMHNHPCEGKTTWQAVGSSDIGSTP